MTPTRIALFLAATLLVSCGDPKEEETDPPVTDADEDGYDALEYDGDDCDDADASVHPGAEEHCDGVDEDCDGTVDEEAVDMSTWLADADEDGYGDDETTQEACELPSGFVDLGGDCDDTNPEAHPGATEDCTDPADLDCDGDSEWADVDDDGWAECVDCNDANPMVNPDGTEICNDVDDDCDGGIDVDATDAPTWYANVDGDGFGDPAVSLVDCDQPSGYVADSTDCDDTRADVNPLADELCDDVDLNCDGDPILDAVDKDTWYEDADEDGYGDPDVSMDACEQPSGYVDDDQDCDDTDDSVNPDATDVCDLVDNDCNGTMDDGCPEICDDGYDNDSDGRIDCLDTDCATVCPETDCSDGVDDDSDGLVDCEDADCAADPLCIEDCTDTLDNDADGLTDCEDDDCWGTTDCPTGTRSQVLSATSLTFDRYTYVAAVIGCGYSWLSSTSSVQGAAYSVSGVVQTIPSSQNWGTATSWNSCAWTVDSVLFDDSSILRSGFNVESGCDLSTSGFLPQTFSLGTEAMVRLASGTAWYQGSVVDSSSTSAVYTTALPCWGTPGWQYGYHGPRSQTFTISPVSSGSTYLQE